MLTNIKPDDATLAAIGDHIANDWEVKIGNIYYPHAFIYDKNTYHKIRCIYLKLELINDKLTITDFTNYPLPTTLPQPIIKQCTIELNNPNAITKLDKLLTTIKNFHNEQRQT